MRSRRASSSRAGGMSASEGSYGPAFDFRRFLRRPLPSSSPSLPYSKSCWRLSSRREDEERRLSWGLASVAAAQMARRARAAEAASSSMSGDSASGEEDRSCGEPIPRVLFSAAGDWVAEDEERGEMLLDAGQGRWAPVLMANADGEAVCIVN